MTNNTLQERMFAERAQKALFRQVQAYAFDYADRALTRNVYPSDDALANLGEFVEALPEDHGDAQAILAQLHRVGSPATVAQSGGRYFGLGSE